MRTRIGTWNVRTMNEGGKLENVKCEMKRNGLSILGLSEVRWLGEGEFDSDDFKVIYSGGTTRHRGVAMILDRETAKRLVKVERYGDRAILIKIQAEPIDLVVLQVYMPTTEHDDEEVDELYQQLESVIDEQKGTDFLVVMGDWNAVVGEGQEENEIGQFGLGKRNDRGEKLIEFCKRRKLMAANTWFQQPYRRRYTWKKPGDTGRYQIDYILVCQRYRNSVKCARSYPGADVNSDHNLVAMDINVRLKKIKRMIRPKKWNLEELDRKKQVFQNGIELDVVHLPGSSVLERWTNMKEIVTRNAEKVIGYRKKKCAKKPWVTVDMTDKMAERRKWKNVNTEEGQKRYRKCNNELRRETDIAREKWWQNECNELEELEKKGKMDTMYAKVKQLTCRKESGGKVGPVKNAAGKLLTEPDEIRNRWKEYIEVLYDKQGKPTHEDIALEEQTSVQDDCMGPDLIDSEIKDAIRQMKTEKAEGEDGIPAEFWKALGDNALIELVEIFKDMSRLGIWPTDFTTRVVVVPLKRRLMQLTVKITER